LVITLAGPGTMPVGPEVWAGTEVGLPPGAPGGLSDVLAPSTVNADDAVLSVAKVLATFPVAKVLVAG
jgi:maltooligosyltrehalose synthase